MGIGHHPELPLDSFHIELPSPCPLRSSCQTLSKIRADFWPPRSRLCCKREIDSKGGGPSTTATGSRKPHLIFSAPPRPTGGWGDLTILALNADVRATNCFGPSGPCPSPCILSYAQAMWKQALLDFRMRNRQLHWGPPWGRSIII